MKSWIKRALFGVVGATVVAGGLAGCARDHHGSWSDERVGDISTKVVEKIGHKLTLNDTQKQKLTVLADELVAQRKAFRGQGNPRDDVKALVAGDKFDRERAQALLTDKTQRLQSAGPKVLAALADFYDSLDSTQQQQVRERLAERRGWWVRG